MTESTVTIKHDDQRQSLLKEVSLKISALKDFLKHQPIVFNDDPLDPYRVCDDDISFLKDFKVFLSVKGSFTITMSDIIKLRNILDKDF